MNYWKDKDYWKDKVERGDYTDEEWNRFGLWRYVNYRKDAKTLKELINEQHDTTTTSK